MTDSPSTPDVTIIRVGDEQGRGGLYNILFEGGFERAGLLLPLINIDPACGSVFRVRDAWVEKHILTGELVVHVYTRVGGGGNRDKYADIIQQLRDLPGYVRDADDSFDSTYASFWFRISDEVLTEVGDTLADIAVDPVNTGERWRDMAAAVEKKA